MRLFIVLLVALLIGCGGSDYLTHEPEPSKTQVEELGNVIDWQFFGSAAAIDRTTKDGVPAYMYFYSSNLESGQMNVTLNDPKVAKLINEKFVPFKFNVENDRDAEVAKLLLKHTKAPTQMVVAKTGKDDLTFYELHGYVTPNECLRALSVFK